MNRVLIVCSRCGGSTTAEAAPLTFRCTFGDCSCRMFRSYGMTRDVARIVERMQKATRAERGVEARHALQRVLEAVELEIMDAAQRERFVTTAFLKGERVAIGIGATPEESRRDVRLFVARIIDERRSMGAPDDFVSLDDFSFSTHLVKEA